MTSVYSVHYILLYYESIVNLVIYYLSIQLLLSVPGQSYFKYKLFSVILNHIPDTFSLYSCPLISVQDSPQDPGWSRNPWMCVSPLYETAWCVHGTCTHPAVEYFRSSLDPNVGIM